MADSRKSEADFKDRLHAKLQNFLALISSAHENKLEGSSENW